jgi:hypothetical protein
MGKRCGVYHLHDDSVALFDPSAPAYRRNDPRLHPD